MPGCAAWAPQAVQLARRGCSEASTAERASMLLMALLLRFCGAPCRLLAGATCTAMARACGAALRASGARAAFCNRRAAPSLASCDARRGVNAAGRPAGSLGAAESPRRDASLLLSQPDAQPESGGHPFCGVADCMARWVGARLRPPPHAACRAGIFRVAAPAAAVFSRTKAASKPARHDGRSMHSRFARETPRAVSGLLAAVYALTLFTCVVPQQVCACACAAPALR